MLNNFAIMAINLLLKANPQSQEQLSKYSTKVIALHLPFLSIQFIIAANGTLEAETSSADCEITIPLGAASHMIQPNEMKTFKSFTITGDKNLAKGLLSILADIDASKALYLHQNPFLSMFATKLEKMLADLVAYAKLVLHNGGLSTSQYIQYEVDMVANKWELEEFYNQVDNTRERVELLAKRVEKLINQE